MRVTSTHVYIVYGQAQGPQEAGHEPGLPGHDVSNVLAAEQSPEPGQEVFWRDWQPPLRV